MSYNGVAAEANKGTGLSGFVQRSRAISRLSAFRTYTGSSGVDDESTFGLAANPLAAKRSARENDDLARRLREHEALRAVKVQVAEYKEKQLQKGVPQEAVDAEADELYNALHDDFITKRDQRRKDELQELRSSDRFAAALGIKPGSAVGDAFDRTKQQEEREKAELERRQHREELLAERVKRIRGE